MIARIVVILFIFISVMIGVVLILFPWVSFGGFGDWGDHYLLRLAVERTGYPMIQTVVGSNWFRGAVTGLGVFNIFLAFWEVAHFDENVAALNEG
jgi:hypothetical protein